MATYEYLEDLLAVLVDIHVQLQRSFIGLIIPEVPYEITISSVINYLEQVLVFLSKLPLKTKDLQQFVLEHWTRITIEDGCFDDLDDESEEPPPKQQRRDDPQPGPSGYVPPQQGRCGNGSIKQEPSQNSVCSDIKKAWANQEQVKFICINRSCACGIQNVKIILTGINKQFQAITSNAPDTNVKKEKLTTCSPSQSE